jgi:hypothetical protein
MSTQTLTQAKLLKELKATLYPARNEYSALWVNEREKRGAIIKARIIEAGLLVGNCSGVIDALLNHSTPIQAISALEIPSQSVLFCDSAEQITGIAKRILESYQQLETEKAKTI